MSATSCATMILEREFGYLPDKHSFHLEDAFTILNLYLYLQINGHSFILTEICMIGKAENQ